MSAIQKFFLAVFPAKWAQSMEAESRAWMLKCPVSSCGHERSFWEIGGIRWKAAGNPKKFLKCPKCGQHGWHTVSFKSPQ